MPGLFGIIVFVISQQADSANDIQFFLDANENAIKSVFSIQADLEHDRIPRDDPKGNRKRAFECQWSFSDPERVERVRWTDHERKPDSKGNPTGIYDVLVVGSSDYKLLLNWDPAHPQRIGPVERGSCRGEVGNVQTTFPGGYDPRASLLWLTQSVPVPRSLKESAHAAAKLTLKERAPVNGFECIVISFEGGDNNDDMEWIYDVYLDPTVNFLVRRFVATAPNVKVNGQKEPLRIEVKADVLEFQEPKPGIFVPLTVRIDRSDSKFITQIGVEHLVVNEPLPNEVKELHYPEWCWVTDVRTRETDIYGPNDTVIRHLRNTDDENKWIADNSSSASRMATRPAWIIVAVNVGFLLVVVALLARMRLRRRRA